MFSDDYEMGYVGRQFLVYNFHHQVLINAQELVSFSGDEGRKNEQLKRCDSQAHKGPIFYYRKKRKKFECQIPKC